MDMSDYVLAMIPELLGIKTLITLITLAGIWYRSGRGGVEKHPKYVFCCLVTSRRRFVQQKVWWSEGTQISLQVCTEQSEFLWN